MVDFDIIKSRVTIRDILADCGLHPAKNRMPCPIHGGHNPTAFSFNDETFYCFNCGASGGLLDLTRALMGIGRDEALKYLAEKAGLRWEDYADGKQRSTIPVRKPRLLRPGEIERDELALKLYALDILREHYTGRLQKLRKWVRNGLTGLSGFHSDTQYCGYALEELDTLYIYTKHQKTMIMRGLSNARNYG